MFSEFLSESDARRLLTSLQRIRRHVTDEWALTGGLAASIHHDRSRSSTVIRSLNDIDFVVPRFDCIPRSIASEFLCRHIHPLDPPGKTVAQFVDAENKLRIDVFRTTESVLSRTIEVTGAFGTLRLVSAEDLSARLARILLQLGNGVPAPPKHAEDFCHLMETIDLRAMQPIWCEHRRPNQPESFEEARELTMRLVTTHQHLLVVPRYSTDTDERCDRCVCTTSFPLADAGDVLSILGYC